MHNSIEIFSSLYSCPIYFQAIIELDVVLFLVFEVFLPILKWRAPSILSGFSESFLIDMLSMFIDIVYNPMVLF